MIQGFQLKPLIKIKITKLKIVVTKSWLDMVLSKIQVV